MKKILILTDEYPPNIGGAGIAASAYVNALSSFYSISLVTASGKHLKSPYCFQKKRFIWPIQYYLQFKRLKLEDYDIVILNDGPVQFAASLFFSSKLLRRSIAIVHGVEKLVLRPSAYSKLFSYPKRIEQLYNSVSVIVGVSNYILDEVDKYFNLPNVKKKVIYTPVKLEKLELSRKEFSILSVGRIVKEKGFLRMYRVFKLLKNSDKRWEWTIVGDGEYLSELKSIVEDDGFQDSVHFAGNISHQNLSIFYSSHSVFFLLSEYFEAFGLVYLEALSCGMPVVGYSQYGPAEIFDSVSSCFGVEFNCKDELICAAIKNAKDSIENGAGLENTIFSLDKFRLDISEVLSDI